MKLSSWIVARMLLADWFRITIYGMSALQIRGEAVAGQDKTKKTKNGKVNIKIQIIVYWQWLHQLMAILAQALWFDSRVVSR